MSLYKINCRACWSPEADYKPDPGCQTCNGAGFQIVTDRQTRPNDRGVEPYPG